MSHKFRKDKVVLVTGSSKGLGKATAIYLAKKGAKIIINGRDKKTLHQVANQFDDENIELIAMQGDLTKPHECEDIIQSIIKTYKKLDCLINNVGFMARGPLEDTSLEMIEASINTNLMTSIYCSKYAIPHLKVTKGSIVFVSSLGGIRGIPNIATYCAAKMGIRAFCESIQGELKKHQIHCGVVFPGYIKSYKEKHIYTNDGHEIPAPKTARHRPKSVAKAIAKLVQNRHSKKIIGRRSKGFALLNTIMPGLLAWLIQKMTPKNIIPKTFPTSD